MADPQWKKNLRKASFRGVSFRIESHSLAGGRRGVQHEYAQRDEPFTEDTGRKARKFSVDAYILGEDYMPSRDALKNALEEFGPGELIHPYLGRHMVNCFDYTLKESTRDGGMAIFTISFVEAGKEQFPDSRADALSSTLAAAQAVKDSKLEQFKKGFSVAKKPQFVLDAATEKIRNISDMLASAQDKSGGFLAASASAAAAIMSLRSQAEQLIHAPERLFSEIEKSFALLFDAITDKRSGFEASSALTGYGNNDDEVAPITVTRQQQGNNQNELNSATRLIALAEASVSAVQIDFESRKDAQGIRSTLLRTIDDESDAAGTDDVYEALQDLRVEIAKHIPGDAENLSIVSEITPKETTTSLTLAYDVYGSVSREAEVVQRNKIRTPGFIAGGSPVEVLLPEDG